MLMGHIGNLILKNGQDKLINIFKFLTIPLCKKGEKSGICQGFARD